MVIFNSYVSHYCHYQRLPETLKFPESPSSWEQRPRSEVTVPETFVAVVSLSSEKSLGPKRSGHRLFVFFDVFWSEKMRRSTQKCEILVGETVVNVPFWEYWTSPYSSHLVDHIPNGWVM